VSGEELRILFIEDREEDVDLLLRELRQAFRPDYARVQTAEGLRGALGEPWDIAICDWVLPGFSAPDAIAMLREEAAFDGAIIVVSGSMGEDLVVEAMRAGAHDYVVKDNLHRLVPAVIRELNEAENRREIRRTGEALRRQALIFENIHDAVVIVDREGDILDLNPAAEELTGLPRSVAVGRRADFLGGADVKGLGKEITSRLETDGRWSGVLPAYAPGGGERFLDLVVVPLSDAEGNVLGSVGVSRDVTERIRTEERLRETIDELRRTDHHRRQLLSRLVAAQEEERQRIAGEIHDDPVQQLYAATLRLGMLHERITDEQDREALGFIEGILGRTIMRLRHMLFELQPRSLENEGLGSALAEYVKYANEESETAFALDDRLTTPLSTDMRAVAYRLVLEAVSNVRKHAGATRATVTIADQEDGILCTVTDDGRGFLLGDRVDAFRPGHLGLPAMRERAELAGGRLEIASAPGEGTTVEFWLPAT
jgi:two-component system, NarL family, sensor histidine kinase UhpB